MNPEFKEEVGHLVKTKLEKLGSRESVVFYGSSSLRLWESLSTDFPELDCLNIAFGGSTIKDCLDYYDVLLKRTNPVHIFFYAGDNDIGQNASSEETINRFKELYFKIRKDFKEVSFTFLSIKPSPQRIAFLNSIQEVNQEIKSFLSTEDKAQYLDVFSSMIVNKEIDKTLFIEDELHMNKKGYDLWKMIIRPHFGLKN